MYPIAKYCFLKVIPISKDCMFLDKHSTVIITCLCFIYPTPNRLSNTVIITCLCWCIIMSERSLDRPCNDHYNYQEIERFIVNNGAR